jgi:hypothetical protein
MCKGVYATSQVLCSNRHVPLSTHLVVKLRGKINWCMAVILLCLACRSAYHKLYEASAAWLPCVFERSVVWYRSTHWQWWRKQQSFWGNHCYSTARYLGGDSSLPSTTGPRSLQSGTGLWSAAQGSRHNVFLTMVTVHSNILTKCLTGMANAPNSQIAARKLFCTMIDFNSKWRTFEGPGHNIPVFSVLCKVQCTKLIYPSLGVEYGFID